MERRLFSAATATMAVQEIRIFLLLIGRNEKDWK
jgi:hypothetical protein